MNQPRISQSGESPKTACVANAYVRMIATEQLCAWLEKRRREAIESRRSARKIMERMSCEIADIDELLASLKIR